jgi:hypothetical protein
MSSGRAQPGNLARSLAALTIGIEKNKQTRAAALADTYTGEWEEQVHVELSGNAEPAWTYVDKQVSFQLVYLWAPAQRWVPFSQPHFGVGFEQTAGATNVLLLLHAYVIAWTITEELWCVGATVRFAVCAPNDAVNSSSVRSAQTALMQARADLVVGQSDEVSNEELAILQARLDLAQAQLTAVQQSVTALVPYKATAHLDFQGYGTMAQSNELADETGA